MGQIRYSKTVPEPDRVMQRIGECRKTILQASLGVRPFGPAYHALSMVTAAIDALATFITGERHYFATRDRGEAPSTSTSPGLDLDEVPHILGDEPAGSKPAERL